MTDAFHHISEDAKSVASFLGGFRLAFAICLSWSVAFYLDVAVLGMRCAENAPVEWLQFALIAASGAMMAARAVRVSRGRAAFILASAFFFDMAIREQDALLDVLLWHGGWAWIVGIVTAVAFMLALRCRETLKEGLGEIRSSGRFLFLAAGLAVILVVSRIMGMKHVWMHLGDPAQLCKAKRVVEEGLELFGYMLIFAWALPCFPPRKTCAACGAAQANIKA